MAKATRKPKIAPKAPAPAPTTPGQGPGVIAALIEALRDGGGTIEELYAKLAARFPERASTKGGMRTTVKIQLKRLPATGKLTIESEEVEGRGIVYKAAK
jgi:hypothetical protein